MQRIKILSSLVTNQIAAGEVIERPASVVKELLENALDANATNIKIEIIDSGVQCIKITDNGYGIHPEDLLLALTPHATSKITDSEDLNMITSLGFRGEALSSIKAISRIEIMTKTITQEVGYKIVASQDDVSVLEKNSCEVGTTITVKDLFFNVPVRRKFLKSEKTELSHIDTIIKRIALSRFDVKFSVFYQGKQVYNLPVASNMLQQEKRVSKILGSKFLSHALYIEIKNYDMKFYGWITNPELARQQTDWQYFYLNGRVVRDKLIYHAIRQAYEDMLPAHIQPAYVLYLELPPSKIDVNVHPTKYEVRFLESRLIHDFIVSTIKEALLNPNRSINTSSEIFFKEDVEQDAISNPRATITPTVNKLSSHDTLGDFLATLHEQFLLLKDPKGLIIIDIKEAYVEYIYCLLSKEIDGKNFKPFIIPQTVVLNSKESIYVQQHQDFFKALGIILVELGESTFVIREAISIYKNIDFNVLFDSMKTLNMQKCDNIDSLRIILVNALREQLNLRKIFSDSITIEFLTQFLQKRGNPHTNFYGKKIWGAITLAQISDILYN